MVGGYNETENKKKVWGDFIWIDRQGIELEEQDGQEWLALQYQAEKMKKKYLMKYNTFEYEQKIKQGLFRKGFAIEDINRWLEKEKELDVD